MLRSRPSTSGVRPTPRSSYRMRVRVQSRELLFACRTDFQSVRAVPDGLEIRPTEKRSLDAALAGKGNHVGIGGVGPLLPKPPLMHFLTIHSHKVGGADA